MRACFMSMVVIVSDFVFPLSFPVKSITSAVTRSGTVFGDVDDVQ